MLKVRFYLADQNPHRDRSFGITTMTDCLLKGIDTYSNEIDVTTFASKSSFTYSKSHKSTIIPWRTDRFTSRIITDNFHYCLKPNDLADINYYPKGFLPFVLDKSIPNVITVHDTILQWYADKYPESRSNLSFWYWLEKTKHSLTRADLVLTVSKTSKGQIQSFCERYGIRIPNIKVTYEASSFEDISIPKSVDKKDQIVHLASMAPHKRSSDLICWWAHNHDEIDASRLVVIGNVNDDLKMKVANCSTIDFMPYLSVDRLVNEIMHSRLVVISSEIEGFGLPAIEAYYLNTPVCFSQNTSISEILGADLDLTCSFDLLNADSIIEAVNRTLALSEERISEINNRLRKKFSVRNFVEKFEESLSSMSKNE